MTEWNESEILPNEGPEYLEQIKGLGPKCAETLYGSGIRQFATLAGYTPEDLEGLLQFADIQVSAKTIVSKDWLGQARKLAVLEALVQENAAQDKPQAVEGPAPQADKEKWEQQAGFSVFFEYRTDEYGKTIWQTRVYHDETGGLERRFPGTAAVDWPEWMRAQAVLPEAEPAQPQQRGKRRLATIPAVRESHKRKEPLKITNVEVLEKGSPSAGTEARLAIAVNFELQGQRGQQLAAERNPFKVELQMIHQETGVAMNIESSQQWLDPAQTTYKVTQHIPVPEPGRHHLKSFVRFPTAGEAAACQEGPTIHVVP